MKENIIIEDTCDIQEEKLISTSEALAVLMSAPTTSISTQKIDLDDAMGRVLAEDVVSKINVPGFDNSSMDGYALHLKDEQINKPGGFEFVIAGRIAAGEVGEELDPGCAARIFTGAPIPKGANAVVMQEEADLINADKKIEIWKPITLNENIRPLGNDIKSGGVILTKGKLLTPADMGLIASVGIAEVDVYRKIKVGVFFTGSELINPGEELEPGKIYNSNKYSLVAMLKQLNCEVMTLGNIMDTEPATIDALGRLEEDCDVIITTGGVSVGEEDHVKPAVQKMGVLHMWKIKMKPGKPLAFGKIGGSHFIGLPGNPVSVMATFMLFATPFIKKLQGCAAYENKAFQVQTGFAWPRPKHRREFVRVQIDSSTTPPTVNMYKKQGSDVLTSMSWADGLAEIPENVNFKQGELVNYYSMKGLML